MKLLKWLLSLTMGMSLIGCSNTVESDGVPRPSTCGNLQVIDGKLSDEKGNPVVLKGVSTHSLPRTEPFINEECFEEISKDWKVNVVRLAMYTYGQDSYNKTDYFKEKNLELIDQAVEYATKSDMYVMIDWHVLSEGDPMYYKEESIDFFDSMSKKYADSNNVIYEICNEPNGVDWKTIKDYANEVIPVIRANDSDSLIIVGTPEWSQRVDEAMADSLDFENIMYTLHFYAATHKEDLQDRLRMVSEKGFPVFVTEYGVTASNGGFPRDFESSEVWMDLLDEFGISSCIWTFARTGEAVSIFGNSKKTSDFTEEDLTETGIWFKDMLKKTYDID